MAGKGKRNSSRCTLLYPKHRIKPDDVADFVEMDGFRQEWKTLGLNDDDLQALQVAIMSLGPSNHAVVRGTGGLRKGKFAPSTWHMGKRGAVRVCFVYFEQFSLVLLMKAYPKNVKDDLTDKERKDIKQAISLIERQLAKERTRV